MTGHQLPRLHPREKVVRQAEMDLLTALETVITQHKLTVGECMRVVVAVLGGHIGGIARSTIRVERHGDANKPGGIE